MREELERDLQRLAPQFLAEMDLDEMESCMAWGFECGDGWYMPLKRFCEAVEAMNNASPDKVIVAKQIKAKFGEMTVYWALEERGKPLLERECAHDEQMEYLMRDALLSLMSECRETCELCGSTENVSEERWIYICKRCKEERNKNKWSGWNVANASDSPSQVN